MRRYAVPLAAVGAAISAYHVVLPVTIAGDTDRIRGAMAGSALPAAFVVAALATLGSLWFSEVAHFEPCRLCWYQRIAMYPLVLILGIAAWRGDSRVRRYAVPLAAVGAAAVVGTSAAVGAAAVGASAAGAAVGAAAPPAVGAVVDGAAPPHAASNAAVRLTSRNRLIRLDILT